MRKHYGHKATNLVKTLGVTVKKKCAVLQLSVFVVPPLIEKNAVRVSCSSTVLYCTVCIAVRVVVSLLVGAFFFLLLSQLAGQPPTGFVSACQSQKQGKSTVPLKTLLQGLTHCARWRLRSVRAARGEWVCVTREPAALPKPNRQASKEVSVTDPPTQPTHTYTHNTPLTHSLTQTHDPPHASTRTHTHAHTHARTHTHAHARTRTPSCSAANPISVCGLQLKQRIRKGIPPLALYQQQCAQQPTLSFI